MIKGGYEMASRMIHYTIAKLFANKMKINNRNEFLIGSLAPDMASYEADVHAKGIYKRVHFQEEFKELGVKGFNWLTFYHKYLKENSDDEFALGYFVHLICDTIWLADVQAKYVLSVEQETPKEKIFKGYDEIRKCNYHIAENYGICYDVHPLETFTVAEANIVYQTSLLDDLKRDFLPYGDNFDLEIYNWNTIIDYIEKCVQVCLKEVELVIQGKEPDSPIPYMAPIDLKL